MNGVHEHKRIHRLQRTILPGCDLRHDLFADLRYQFRRDLHAVQFLDLLSDIPLAHAAGVQRQDLILHSVRVSVILADDLGFEGAIPVPGNLDVHLTQLGLDGLLRVAVAVVSGGALRLVRALATLSTKLLVHLHFHDGLDDVPEHFLHGIHDLRRAGEVLALNIFLQQILRYWLHNLRLLRLECLISFLTQSKIFILS